MAAPSATGSQRFKIAIKSAEEAAATPRGGDAGALRAAAAGLRLGGLGALSASSAESTPFPSARSASANMARAGSGVSAAAAVHGG